MQAALQYRTPVVQIQMCSTGHEGVQGAVRTVDMPPAASEEQLLPHWLDRERCLPLESTSKVAEPGVRLSTCRGMPFLPQPFSRHELTSRWAVSPAEHASRV